MSRLLLGVLSLFCLAAAPAQSTPIQLRDSTDTTVLGDSLNPLRVLPDESEVRRIEELAMLTAQVNGVIAMRVSERQSSQQMGVELR